MHAFAYRLFWLNLFVCAILPLAVGLQAAEERVVRVQVDPRTVVSRISSDFMGFGYETAAAAQPNYFSATNATLIKLYRNLGSDGLIRIGGNVSDHTQYLPDGASAARTEKETTIINRTNLVDLAGFAHATGWKVMWGLNLGSGSKESAVQEAVDVSAAMGGHLQSFEIGNEVDLLPRFSRNYEAYHAAYLDYKSAIRTALPKAPFCGPDVAFTLPWCIIFANTEAADMKLLTHHYYRAGAKDPKATLETLLKHDGPWDDTLASLKIVCRDKGIPFRINEVNSFSGGGKPGVSDTFASALWCLDYMFTLAAHGCNGINVETDINQLGFISHYSPIVHDETGNCRARPEYYGMLAFALAGKGDLVKITLDKKDINLAAYATRNENGFLWVTVINKDLSLDARMEIAMPKGYKAAEAFRLVAPSVESKDQVTLGGSEVSPDGTWSPQLPEKLTTQEGALRLVASHASAVLVRLRQ